MDSEQRLVNIAILFIATVVLVVVLKELQTFLRPFVLALILTFLLMPVLRFSRRTRLPMSLIIIALVLLLLFLSAFIVWALSTQTGQLNERVATLITSVENLITTTTIGGVALSTIVDPASLGTMAGDIIRQGIAGVGRFMRELFLAILFMLFLMPSLETLVHAIGSSLTAEKRRRFYNAIRETEEAIRTYLYAKTLISLATALATAVILWVFHSDLILVLAVLTFVLNYIPSIGSIVAVGITLCVFALLNGLGWPLFFLALLLFFVQMFFGNYLEPRFAGHELRLSPTIILLSLFLWYWIWGVVGMLLAVPLTSILRIVLSHIDATKRAAQWLS